MKKASYLVTDGIPGVAAKGEIIKVSGDGILIGRWLPMSKYHLLMQRRDSLRAPSAAQHSPPIKTSGGIPTRESYSRTELCASSSVRALQPTPGHRKKEARRPRLKMAQQPS